MAWKPGQTGNPAGRPISRPFLDAVARAITQDDGKRLRACAETLLDLAAKGEPWAVQMLADRLDGKASQEITVKREVRDMSLDEILTELAALDPPEGGKGNKAGAAKPGVVH